jgi:Xaa-Pro aminopeptidase
MAVSTWIERMAISEQALPMNEQNNSVMNERFQKITKLIRYSKISALLIFANPFRQGDLLYATEDHYVNFGFSVICATTQKAIQLVQGSTQYFYAKDHSFVKDVRITPNYSKATEVILDFLATDRSGSGGKTVLGITNLDIFPAQFYLELSKEFELYDVSPQVQELLFRKDQLSIEQSRAPATVADEVMEYIAKKVRIGMSGDSVLGMMQELMIRVHCSDSFNMVSVGKRPKVMFKLCPDRISKGDILTTEITPRLGMWTQLNRPLAMDEPSSEARDSAETCISIVNAASQKVKPGAVTGDIANFMVEQIQSFGYDPITPADMGHLIGFEITENWIRPDSTLKFDSGMTFILHAIINDKNSGFMIVGDTFLLNGAGPERLTKTPQRFFVKQKT